MEVPNESSNDKVDQMPKTEDIAKYLKESKQHQQNMYQPNENLKT